MLREAIQFYDLDPATLQIEDRLHGMYHSDYHYKIRVEEKCYSARFIGKRRYEHDVFFELTDQVLAEQLDFIDHLNRHGIPFMRLQPASTSKFVTVSWKNVDYRFLLFEWIEGRHITHCTESVSFKFGEMARKFHEVALHYRCSLPKQSQFVGTKQLLALLECACSAASLTTENWDLLQNYIHLANKHINRAYAGELEFTMQSDMNPLNILWDEDENIVGIIDFEHIGYCDRVEGLAWLIKWYSRTKGLKSHEVSPALTESLLLGYRAQDFLRQEDRQRLSSLLWLTGCLNWGFVDKTKKILESKDHSQLHEHLAKFRDRGLNLSALISI
ncbi:phosphotransferase enzyme family protein [Paenibacillus mendelii]|uniref:Phosphotransferase enzyme family protein n=1 Tax=Paenibacillus mendelii TaxID=206163 RepID=A0ABV6JAP3_9BACL|nr:phosphotransferase [Paenibacillus mendelii]MCQ6563754.1 phosphotransferase [Paenibacillus mendelii]